MVNLWLEKRIIVGPQRNKLKKIKHKWEYASINKTKK